jgi:RNA-directed DNA polymerase
MTDRDNLNRAYRRVLANKGAPGVDGLTVRELKTWIAGHKAELIASLVDGSVEIPKPGGGVRQLGIPTVVDRLVQQTILQVLEPLLDPTFSDASFGFRTGRGAHDGLTVPATAHEGVPAACALTMRPLTSGGRFAAYG